MSNYHIYQSNSLAGLVKKYSRQLTSSDLFDNSFCLIVQNRNMGEWLKLELARHRGVCADFEYVMPENGLRDFCAGYPSARKLLGPEGGEKPVLFLDNLKLILYKTLESLLKGKGSTDPAYRELYRYVHAEDPANKKDIADFRANRLYELADSIAGLFNHYGMNCRDLILPWERGEPFPDMPPSLKKHEEWQRKLWNVLFHSDQSYVHLSQLLSEVMQKGDSYDGGIKRLVLFGSSFLGDTGLNFFYHLSQDIRVDHFILSPSRVYSRWNGQVENALLKSWSTLIGGFATLSGSFKGAVRQNDYSSAPGTSLLSSLQNDLLDDRQPEGRLPVSLDDRSLCIHTFTSPWREIEVLKDLILDELNRDPSLKLTEICVLAPDINEYAPFLEALFPSWGSDYPHKDHLPYNVVDLEGGSDSPFIQGFLQLFEMPGGRFSRKDLFLLFDNPCFCETFQIHRQERDFWLQLCESLNIRWGVSGDHKRDFYPEATDFNSWGEAFRRLRDGFFLDEEDDESLPFGLWDETGNQSAGKLMEAVESLFNDLYELNRIRLPLGQWILLSEAVMETYLTVREDVRQDEKDRWRLKGTFRDLLALSEEAELDFKVFRILLTEFIRKSGGERGRYLTQGITCSSLKPLRAIPFRRIYILGLNESSFPGEDLKLSFDLREVVQQTIDLSRRGSDKYAFLETLLSAGDALTLFFSDRDSVRGEVLQPSILISELFEYLDRYYSFPGEQSAAEWLTRRESIHDYDIRYFNGEAGFRSFNTAALKSALISRSPESGGDIPINLDQREEGMRELLTIRDLEQFLQNPASYYFKKSLGIYLAEEDNREEESEENWESPFMDRYLYLSRTLEDPDCLARSGSLQEYLQDQQKRGFLPDSPLIFLEEDFFELRLEEIRTQLEEKGLVSGLPSPRDYLIDPEEATGLHLRDEDLHPPRIIPALTLSLSDGERVRIAGLLEELSPLPEEPGFWGTLEYCEAGTPGTRHYLKSYIKALLMSALSEQNLVENIRALRLFQVGKRSYPLLDFIMNPSPGAVEKGEVPLSDPVGKLGRLVRLCLEQLSRPLMVYPEIGIKIARELAVRPDMNDQELLRVWENTWSDLSVSDDFAAYSPFSNCPYRRQFLPEPPLTDPLRLRDLIETVYLPFCISEVP